MAASAPAAGFSTWYLFATSLAVGCATPLLLLPVRELGRRFFVLCTLISLVFFALAVVTEGLAIGALQAICAALLLVYNVTLPKKGRRLSGLVLLGAVLAGNAALVSDALALRPAAASGAAGRACLTASVLSSSALLGTSLVAMVLGHWYLVVRGLSFEFLRRLTLALGAALAFRAVSLIASAAVQRGWFAEQWETLGPSGFGLSYGLFLGAEVLFGVLAPAVLVVMTAACVRERANQSATGILYVVAAFVLIGEIIAKHLLASSGLVA
jgi:hypothetical protein